MDVKAAFWTIFAGVQSGSCLLTVTTDFGAAKLALLLMLNSMLFWILHISVFRDETRFQATTDRRRSWAKRRSDSIPSLVGTCLAAAALLALSYFVSLKFYATSVSALILAVVLLAFHRHLGAITKHAESRAKTRKGAPPLRYGLLLRNAFCFAIPIALDLHYNVLTMSGTTFAVIAATYLAIVYATMGAVFASFAKQAARMRTGSIT